MKLTPDKVPNNSWGEGCKAFNLVDSRSLSVLLETMPPGTSEQLHKHQRSQQYFHVLSGEAEFQIEQQLLKIRSGEGVHVKPGKAHAIANRGTVELKFLVVSEPPSHQDRINLEV